MQFSSQEDEFQARNILSSSSRKNRLTLKKRSAPSLPPVEDKKKTKCLKERNVNSVENERLERLEEDREEERERETDERLSCEEEGGGKENEYVEEEEEEEEEEKKLRIQARAAKKKRPLNVLMEVDGGDGREEDDGGDGEEEKSSRSSSSSTSGGASSVECSGSEEEEHVDSSYRSRAIARQKARAAASSRSLSSQVSHSLSLSEKVVEKKEEKEKKEKKTAAAAAAPRKQKASKAIEESSSEEEEEEEEEEFVEKEESAEEFEPESSSEEDDDDDDDEDDDDEYDGDGESVAMVEDKRDVSRRKPPLGKRRSSIGKKAAAAATKDEKEAAPKEAAAKKEEGQEEEQEEENQNPTQEQLESQRAANVAAVVGNLPMKVRRRPLLPAILTVLPFKPPSSSSSSLYNSDAFKRKLMMRKRFVPWGSQGLPSLPVSSQDTSATQESEEGGEPLVLWQSDEDENDLVEVDKKLTKFLRPHQREGVQFMFECVTGLKQFEGNGCILADDMGLGKTLQGISLLWTLLRQGSEQLGGKPVVKRCVIVCPTSLVGNWENECEKWLDGRIKVLALAESSREGAIMGVQQFLSPRKPYDVLIVSYETFRIHTEKFKKEGSLDLLICDEAHRLKNGATLTNQALNLLPCKRRVLLSGTPMQNHLDEFYAMVNFCNPGVLGTPGHFRKHFEVPVLAGREPDATEKQIERSNERSLELSTIVNEFILRRTNTLLSKHLPPKTMEVVCCKMTKLQADLYKHFLDSKTAQQMMNAAEGKKTSTKKTCRVLSAITALKKLCNHPKLIYDVVHSTQSDSAADGFKDCEQFFPPGLFDNGRVGRGGMAPGWEVLSGKFAVLSRILEKLRRETKDRIVIVSNYTQTLDLMVQLCRERRYPYVRLDGTVGIKKRNRLVKEFNDPHQDQFVFLLSSKAGGCGLNLIGANRLILFDPDWNPATDKQAAARVWRDGQKKNVFEYRFLATGTIEEKVFQRQLSKEGLQGLVSKSGKANSLNTSSEVLRELFLYRGDTLSDTYDQGDLKDWTHHFTLEKLPDNIMQKSAENDVSFIFSMDVVGELKPME